MFFYYIFNISVYTVYIFIFIIIVYTITSRPTILMYLRKRFSHIKSRIPGVHLLRDPAFLVYSVFRVTFGDGKYCLLNVSFISIVVDQTTFQDDLTFIVGQFAQRQGKRC